MKPSVIAISFSKDDHVPMLATLFPQRRVLEMQGSSKSAESLKKIHNGWIAPPDSKVLWKNLHEEL